METSISKNDKNLGMLMHLSTFSKFFFPFGNFIAPLILWTTNKDKPFIDKHGKEAINFQISMFLYTLALGLICIPFFLFYASDFISLVERIDDAYYHARSVDLHNLTGYFIAFIVILLISLGLFILELYAVINASIKASEGKEYKYPFSIKFIKTNNINQSKNEHSS